MKSAFLLFILSTLFCGLIATKGSGLDWSGNYIAYGNFEATNNLTNVFGPSSSTTFVFDSDNQRMYYRLGQLPSGAFTEYWFLNNATYIMNPAFDPGNCSIITGYTYNDYRLEQAKAIAYDNSGRKYVGNLISRSTCNTSVASHFVVDDRKNQDYDTVDVLRRWSFNQIFGVGPGFCASIVGDIQLNNFDFISNRNSFFTLNPKCYNMMTLKPYCAVNYYNGFQACSFVNRFQN